MQHDEDGHEIHRDKHERLLSHRGRRDRAGEAGSETGTERAGGAGDNEIQQPKEIPKQKYVALLELRSSDESKRNPRRGDPDSHVAKPGRPRKETR
jgi:hypothetical protein